MRLIDKSDASLVAGLIAGTIVIFQRPLRFVWEAAWEVQERLQVDLLPALTIFAGVFLFHEARKRQLVKAEARAAAAEAAQMRLRSAELERLMTFSQALANSLDARTLQQVLWRYLPELTGDREFWLLARRSDRWEFLLPDAARRSAGGELEAVAEQVNFAEHELDARRSGVVVGTDLCYPMVAGQTVGVLGIQDGGTITGPQRQALGIASGMMAVAVRNIELFLETQEHGMRDSLTGCFNRGHGLEALDTELARARRTRRPLSILMFDIDHFKTINDQLGHLRGDDMLRAVGAQLTRVLRSTDIRCRYGGDEFLIILPDTALAGAQQAAESVRRMLSGLSIEADGRSIQITVSLGVAETEQGEFGASALVARADAALYEAKRAGRNQWHAAPGHVGRPESVPVPVCANPVGAATGAPAVLVVDDEPGLREFARLALARGGHDVVTVAGHREALTVLRSSRAISLMLVDVVMPEMDGFELAAEARRITPGLRIVFTSAFAPEPGRLAATDRFLAKPFTSASLTGILEEAS
jgi:diguanylate cyclase (GGDEF)-like protein